VHGVFLSGFVDVVTLEGAAHRAHLRRAVFTAASFGFLRQLQCVPLRAFGADGGGEVRRQGADDGVAGRDFVRVEVVAVVADVPLWLLFYPGDGAAVAADKPVAHGCAVRV